MAWNAQDANYAKRKQYSGDMIHQEAMEWLDKQTGDKPFYGLFTYTLPHAELYQPNDSILQAYVRQLCNDKTFGETDRYHATVNTHAQFAAMITRLDAYVGEILRETQRKRFGREYAGYLLIGQRPPRGRWCRP